ncbi:MAG: VIT1/CCC1 transporter family protein [Planctomycetes bacterium]|nr:VIT1/CCC1 transporter family protein [Planctomycetota bacterium]
MAVPGSNPNELRAMHTHEAIAERIAGATQHSYLGDFVLGAVDGAVTTFAIVAGAAGAGLSSGVALVLGLANVLADGLSMAAGNYLKARADEQTIDRFRKMEERHIDEIPDGEREEIRQIFAGKGFDGAMLEKVVTVITRDRKQWVDTMLTEEWGLPLETPRPIYSATATMTSFVVAGMVPLAPLFFYLGSNARQSFLLASILTATTFFAIGVVRGRLTERNAWLAGAETLVIGGIAAAVAYAVGALLEGTFV